MTYSHCRDEMTCQMNMGFHSIVEVDETEKLNAPAGAVFKGNWVVPHIQQGADDPLHFTVGLQAIDADKNSYMQNFRAIKILTVIVFDMPNLGNK